MIRVNPVRPRLGIHERARARWGAWAGAVLSALAATALATTAHADTVQIGGTTKTWTGVEDGDSVVIVGGGFGYTILGDDHEGSLTLAGLFFDAAAGWYWVNGDPVVVDYDPDARLGFLAASADQTATGAGPDDVVATPGGIDKRSSSPTAISAKIRHASGLHVYAGGPGYPLQIFSGKWARDPGAVLLLGANIKVESASRVGALAVANGTIAGGCAVFADQPPLFGMPWGRSFATIPSGGTVGPCTSYFTYPPVAAAGDALVARPNSNVRIDSVSSATVDVDGPGGAAATASVNTITVVRDGAPRLEFANGNSLLQTSGIICSPATPGGTSSGLQIGAADSRGRLTARESNVSPPELAFVVNGGPQATSSVRVFSAIEDGSNPVAVVKAGAGGLSLLAANSHSGGTFITQGRIEAAPGSLGSGPITVLPGGQLLLHEPGMANDLTIGGHGLVSAQDGALVLVDASVSGLIALSGDAQISGGGSLSGRIACSGSGVPSALKLGRDGGDVLLTLEGGIDGDVNVIKVGSQTVVLKGPSTYSGGTSVYAGTLVVDDGDNSEGSSAAGTGDVHVHGGVLEGSTLFVSGQTVNVHEGGTLEPGRNPGTMVLGGLVCSPGSTLHIEPGDLIVVNGDVTLDGTVIFEGTPSGEEPWLTWTGTLTDNGLDVAGTGGQFVIDTVNRTVSRVPDAAPPTIAAGGQPEDALVAAGGSATFTVAAQGEPPLTYQWYRDGAPIPGAEGAAYTLSPVALGDSGAMFSVWVTNAAGTVVSEEATLTVVLTTPALTWDAPGAITYGMPLGAAQLGASADVPGSFSYSPPAGTVLGAGTAEVTVDFTPSDPAIYAAVSASRWIVIEKATLIVAADDASREYGEPNPTFTGTLSGIRNGDPITASFSTTAGPASPAGTYPIQATVNGPQGWLENYAVSATDGALTVTPRAPAQVVGRHVFYNNSAWDGNTPGASAADAAAIAPDKSALLPGQKATFASYTSYSKGVNGILIDVAGLRGDLTLADFAFRVGGNSAATVNPSTWAAAPAPSTILVTPGAGAGGSHRITLIWPDGAVKRVWLEVTLKATASTGLDADDRFYFGNAAGETGDSATNALVSAIDVNRTHNAGIGSPVAAIDNRYDHDRDGFVTTSAVSPFSGTDRGVVHGNLTALNALRLIAP